MTGFVSLERLADPRLFAPAQMKNEVIHQFQRRGFHFDVEGFQLVAEVVVVPHGGDGDQKAEGGGKQRFANPLNHHHGAEPFLSDAALERIEEADDRAEETDERSGGSSRCKTAQAALHSEVNIGGGTPQGAFGELDHLHPRKRWLGRWGMRPT